MAKKDIKVKKGNRTLIIPDDYIPKHIPGTQTYYPPEGGQPKEYQKLEIKKDSYTYKYLHQVEDNPMFRFRQDIPLLDIDYTTLDGCNQFLSALVAMAAYDDYGYMPNINNITYLIQTKKGIVDIETIIAQIEALEQVAQMLEDRVKDPALLRDIRGILAIDSTTNKRSKRRK